MYRRWHSVPMGHGWHRVATMERSSFGIFQPAASSPSFQPRTPRSPCWPSNPTGRVWPRQAGQRKLPYGILARYGRSWRPLASIGRPPEPGPGRWITPWKALGSPVAATDHGSLAPRRSADSRSDSSRRSRTGGPVPRCRADPRDWRTARLPQPLVPPRSCSWRIVETGLRKRTTISEHDGSPS